MRIIKLIWALFLLCLASASYAEIGALKDFAPSNVLSGQNSTVTITLLNSSSSPSLNVSITDQLPAGIVLASPSNLASSCGGTVSDNGSDEITLSGATIPAAVGEIPGSCTITFDVATNIAGQYINTIPAGALSGTTGGVPEQNLDDTSATLVVQPLAALTGTKVHSPAIIGTGQTTTVTIRLTNNNDVEVTNATFIDEFPLPGGSNTYVLATPPNVNFDAACGGSAAAPGAAAGATQIEFAGLTIPANGGVCTITFDVVGEGDWRARNTIPVESISSPDQDVTNNTFLGDLTIEDDIPVSKGWSSSLGVEGAERRLFITLTNVFNEPITDVTFTDILPNNPGDLVVAPTPDSEWECDLDFDGIFNDGLLPQQPNFDYSPGDSTVAISNGTIPSAVAPDVMRCRLAVNLVAVNEGVYTNVIEAADVSGQISTGALGGNRAVSPPLRIISGGGVGVEGEKRFFGGILGLPPGEPTTVPLLSAPNAQLALDFVNSDTRVAEDFSFIDDFTGIGIEMIGNITVSGDCPTTQIPLATIGTNTQRLEFGTGYDPTPRSIPPLGTCSIRVTVRGITPSTGETPPAPFDTPDTWLNDINPAVDANDQWPTWTYDGAPFEDDDGFAYSRNIRVLNALSVSKLFSGNTIIQNGISRLTITINNPNPDILTNVQFVDALSAASGLGDIVVAATPNLQLDNCGPATVNGQLAGNPAPLAGADTILFTGGVIPAAPDPNTPEQCIVGIDVTSPTAVGERNEIPIGGVTAEISDGMGGSVVIESINLAVDVLNKRDALPIQVNKAFNPDNPPQSQLFTTLTIVLENPDPSVDLTQVDVTDNLPAGMTVRNPQNFSTTCNGPDGTPASVMNNSVSGTSDVLINNINLPRNSNCEILIDVIADSAGTYTNTIQPGQVFSREGAANIDPASDSALIFPNPAIEKVFETDPIQVGEISRLAITISNPSNGTLTVTSLTDNLPPEVIVATPNGADPGTCTGGSVAAVPGSNVVTLSGSVPIAAGSSCTFFADVTSNQTGTWTNEIPESALVTVSGETNLAPAIDDITVLGSGSIEITKQVIDGPAGAPWEFTVSTSTAGCDVNGETSFTITTAANGGTETLTPLPSTSSDDGTTPCVYTVAETTQVGFDVTALSCDNGTPDQANAQVTGVQVATGGTVACTFENTSAQGAVEITKVVTGATEGYVPGSEFGIALDCPDDAFDQTVLLADGATAGPLDIRIGQECSVTEPTIPDPVVGSSYVGYGWGEPIFDPATFTVGDTTTTVTVTNPLSRSQIAVVDPVALVCSMQEAQATFTITVFNQGTDNLDGVQLANDLATTFAPSAGGFSIVSVTSGDLTVNPGFDGNGDTNLLTGVDTLAPGASGTVEVVISVPLSAALPGTTFSNQIEASGTGDATGLIVSDLSDISFSADPDPALDNPTEFRFPCEPLAVPVMNSWALSLLILMVLLLGVAVQRGQKY